MLYGPKTIALISKNINNDYSLKWSVIIWSINEKIIHAEINQNNGGLRKSCNNIASI